MSGATFLQHLLTGVSLGGAYALIAIGYTMVYGILRLINFAHGDIFMMSGYFMIFAVSSMPWFIGVPTALIGSVLLGVVIEKAAYKPLRSAPRMSVMISAIGVSYLLENLATYLFTAIPMAYPEIPGLKKIFTFGQITTSLVTILTPVLTIVLVVLLLQLINKTKMGMAMRAVSKDTEAARLMGIRVDSTISMTFVIGSFLAGIGALLYRRGGSRRNRVDSGRGHRRIYHRYLRDLPGGTGILHILGCLHICAVDYHPACTPDRPVRRGGDR